MYVLYSVYLGHIAAESKGELIYFFIFTLENVLFLVYKMDISIQLNVEHFVTQLAVLQG